MTCKSLESSHEQPWAGWWRRSVAGAALAWTAVCAAFSAKRARSEILFMSSCLHVILIHSMLGRFSQRCPKWAASDDHDAWLLSVRALPHNQNPDTIKASATETTGFIPRIRRPQIRGHLRTRWRRTWACHCRLLALMLHLGSHGFPLEQTWAGRSKHKHFLVHWKYDRMGS